MSMTKQIRRAASKGWRVTGGLVERSYKRRRFIESIRPTDVFIVTYPKSGTTWLRFMVANVIHQEMSDLKAMYTVVPDINDVYLNRIPLHTYAALADPRFFVLHAPYDPALRRTVYVMRDPRDTMVSYYHHHRLTVPGWNTSMREFLQQPRQWPCSWEEHVRGWLRHKSDPRLLIIRYEDMHRDKEGVLRRVLDFSGVSYTQAGIEHALANSEFKRMRALEESHGLGGTVAAGGNGARFMRKGTSGGWREDLSAEELEVLRQNYEPLAHEFGFVKD